MLTVSFLQIQNAEHFFTYNYWLNPLVSVQYEPQSFLSFLLTEAQQQVSVTTELLWLS